VEVEQAAEVVRNDGWRRDRPAGRCPSPFRGAGDGTHHLDVLEGRETSGREVREVRDLHKLESDRTRKKPRALRERGSSQGEQPDLRNWIGEGPRGRRQRPRREAKGQSRSSEAMCCYPESLHTLKNPSNSERVATSRERRSKADQPAIPAGPEGKTRRFGAESEPMACKPLKRRVASLQEPRPR